MKNLTRILIMLPLFGSTLLFAKKTESIPLKVATIYKMVDLDDLQKNILLTFNTRYEQQMDSALYKVEDKKEAAKLIYKANKQFDIDFLDLLSDSQRNKYIKTYSAPEVREKAKAKVKILAKTGKYSEEQLEAALDEIFDYLMLEKIAYTTQRYNISKQKENIAQLKKMEPQSLKSANNYEKIKQQGVRYQDGFQW